MNCEQAALLICARVDGALAPEDQLPLEQHLADCPACRATLEAFNLQHHELQQTFEPRRQAVVAMAAQVNARLVPQGKPATARRWRWRWAILPAAAAAAVVAFLLWDRDRKPTTPPLGPGADTQLAQAGLVPRPRIVAPRAPEMKVGAEIQTRAGERRRVSLPDSSVLYIDQNTHVHLESEWQATVSAGTVFVEVAPRTETFKPLVVHTPKRDVLALGTRFAVQADPAGTEVLVTQGKVGVSGVQTPVDAGQVLARDSEKPAAAPRASHVLDWTRELVAAAESPLVPATQYSGGALVAVDASGQEAKLSLRRYHVDVHIEDGFARTTIDQTYFNHHPWRLEGTFFFPLPPDASLSRLAMYVDGVLNEGGMAEREYARSVYERIVRSQRDPALLEWVDGSTFKMRVFPLEGRQEKRIILSYTQRLSTLYGRTSYRFPAGHSLELVRDWSFQARVKGGAGWQATSPTHPAVKQEKQDGDLVLTESARGVKIDKDVALELVDPAAGVSGEIVRFGRADHEQSGYLMLRFRPELPGRSQAQRRDWVFLFESSADRDPLLARTQIEIIRHLLGNLDHSDTFTVLTVGARTQSWADELRVATPANIDLALKHLETTHLVGGLDLGSGIRQSVKLLAAADNPHLVHVGSGLTAMGTQQDKLPALIPEKVRYIGIGVGKRWGRATMKQAAERTGGYFTQINPDESVAWRAFDLLATLNTPRLLGVQVKAKMAAGQETPAFLIDNPSIAQGEELFAVARLIRPDAMPATLVVSGTLDGEPFSRELTVKDVAGGAGYLPRTWAKLEIDRLLADNALKHKDVIVELSKAMYVMTPFTSLLVLESEQMYRDLKVDRGRKDHWAMYSCPAKIDVVYEPDPALGIDTRNAPQGIQPYAEQVRQSILFRVPPQVVRRQNQEARGEQFMSGSQVDLAAMRNSERLGDVQLWDKRLAERSEPAAVTAGIDTWFMRTARPEATPLGELGIDLYAPGPARLLALQDEVTFRDEFRREALSRTPQPHFLMGLAADRESGRPMPALQTPLSLAFSPDGRRLLGWGGQMWDTASGRELDARRATEQQPDFDIISGLDFGRHGSGGGRMRLLNTDFLGESRNGVMVDGFSPLNAPLGVPPHPEPAFDQTEAAPARIGQIMIVGNEAKSRLLQRWLAGGTPSLMFQRLTDTGDARVFRDLVSYAPGLNTGPTDAQAVLESEARPDLRRAPGKIAPEARRLIDGARVGGWQVVTFGAGKAQLRIAFDAAGRYHYQQSLASGLREEVICDGKALLHLYPELGLASRRTVSRFHRVGLTALLPMLLPPAEDLARGADLVLVDAHTVAVVPHRKKDLATGENKQPPSYQIHLVFGADGHLAERRLVEMPDSKVLARETYDGKGLVRVLKADGKEVARLQLRLAPAEAPKLQPDLADLVVVPMPLRSREHVLRALRLDPNQNLSHPINGCYRYVNREDAVTLLATLTAMRSDEALLVFRHCFHDRDDTPRGLFTLLASAGQSLEHEIAFREHLQRRPDDALTRYLALQDSSTLSYLQSRLPISLAAGIAPQGTFFHRLTEGRELLQRWGQQPHWAIAGLTRKLDERRALAFVRHYNNSPLALALVAQLARSRPNEHRFAELARVWESLGEAERDYEAGYEQARCLLNAGRKTEARALFLKVYDWAIKKKLPPIDSDFHRALSEPGRADDPWTSLLMRSGATLIEQKNRPAVVLLAWQAHQLGDPALFDNLLELALTSIKDDADRLATVVTAIDVLLKVGQDARADRLLSELLERDDLAKESFLWRLGVRLSDKRGHTDQAIARLEHALDLEYANLPPVIELQQWRADYRRLLDHYQAEAGRDRRRDDSFLGRVIRAADRWRAHDPEGHIPCNLAGSIFKSLGRNDLAWDYLTSLQSLKGDDRPSLSGMAWEHCQAGQHELAERAYAVACEADPDNGQLLWDRARNLRLWGKDERANDLLRQLADDGREGWKELQQRARWQLQIR